MERFTGQDAAFLYMETPSVHMHTLKIAVIDLPAKIPYADVFDLVRASMESKLHLVPRLRLRPVEVPAGLHHPLWVHDPNFDIGRHLYRKKTVEPGGPREMDQAIAEIASIQLPRDRPFCDRWPLEGLADGDTLHPLQTQFIEKAALQCGICTPGFLVAAKVLLDREPNPSEEQIRYALAGNLCRCTGYDKIVRAVDAAAKEVRRKRR